MSNRKHHYPMVKPTRVVKGTWRSICVAVALFAGPVLLSAQALPPGQLPPAPPPPPGQLGPAPSSSPDKSANQGKSSTIAVPGTASGSDEPIRVPVRYVLVPTTVLDPDGHGYVNGLTAADFEVFDNDKPQKVEADLSEVPMSVVLVVQANSEIEPVLPTLRKSGILLHGLVTGQDGEVAILGFDHRIQHLQDFTKDPEKIDDAMQKLNAGSSSARLIDAVLEADRMLKTHDQQNNRRHVVLVVSRNLDKGSESHLQETARQMQFDNIIVYSVDISKMRTAFFKQPDYPRPTAGGIPPDARSAIAGGSGPRTQTNDVQESTGNVLSAAPPVYRGIRDLFKKTPAEAFSTFTGGKTYSFAREKAFEEAITDIGADLNSQYLLGYNPNNKNEPGFHNIRVVVNRPGLEVRSRPGYWSVGGQQ